MTKTFICDYCGGTRSVEKEIEFQERHICQDCYMSETTTCADCGERIWNSDNAGQEDNPICQSCRDEHYTTCEDCGRSIHHDNTCYTDDNSDIPYCSNCVDDHRPEGIQSYYYRPEPIFHGEGNRYLGVELEIDEGGEQNSVANTLLNIGNRNEDDIYIKHDGSLNQGMEIVTHPMTLEYHQTQMHWKELMETSRQKGYLSHKAGTCGIHVHVNRSSFGDTTQEQDVAIARVLFFVENHWNELLRFSRRTQKQLSKWAARYGRKDSPKEVLDCAKGNSGGRYTCVNLLNADTIEFRIFRGTLKYNTLIATLQFVEELCNVALFMSDEEMQSLIWSDFMAHLDTDKYPELIQYLKERRLYVSDRVEEEVDV